jgi:hypothetical protein
MKRFVEGTDRGQSTLFPECLEDWIDENNPVRVIDVFVDELNLGELGFDGVAPEVTSLDIAKSVFQVHGVDGTGAVVMRKRVGRAKVLEFFAGLSPCLVGIEACPSAHYWSRELQALGHTVKLMPPSYVKAYLKRGKKRQRCGGDL